MKIYLPREEQDRFLVETVRPLVKDVLDSGAFRYFFFIRYGDPKPHIRLRFFGSSESVLGRPRVRVQTVLQEAVKKFSSGSLVTGRYRPERKRYGGRIGVRLAERLFMQSSLAVLEFLAYRHVQEKKVSRFEFAFVSGEALVSAMGLDAKSKRHAFIRERASDQARAEFEKFSRVFAPVVSRAIAAPGKYWRQTHVLQKSVNDFSEGIAHLFRDRRGLAKLLSHPLPKLAVSYLHMHYNRLGIVPSEEKLIRSVRDHYVQTDIGRSKKSRKT